ncbi:MAG: hypothetical protein RL258_1407, partial [Pseudomonadota bacterium]
PQAPPEDLPSIPIHRQPASPVVSIFFYPSNATATRTEAASAA